MTVAADPASSSDHQLMTPSLAIQLYTLRDECARDLHATLRAVREMGFDAVELAGLHGHAPGQVRLWLDECALGVTSAHASAEELAGDLEQQVALARTLGYSRIVMPWTQARSRPETRQLLSQLARAAAALQEADLSLGYHNHDFELARWPEGGRMLDLVLAEPGLFLEPDLGWLWFAGEDPREFLEQHSSRCPLLHIKDFLVRGQKSFCPVGAGGVGYDTLLPLAARLGSEALIIEQDESPDQDPLAACAQSIRFVRTALGRNTSAERP